MCGDMSCTYHLFWLLLKKVVPSRPLCSGACASTWTTWSRPWPREGLHCCCSMACRGCDFPMVNLIWLLKMWFNMA